ncbi:hypothetical protein B0H13DRAFT_1889905 [Mycena leptocephala]|nr:hypothetical protein B0H13DRAFT_1889905 [Mycena leptocephala]
MPRYQYKLVLQIKQVEVKALEVGSSEQFRSPLALSRLRDLAAFLQGGPKRRALREKTQRASIHTHCGDAGAEAWTLGNCWEVCPAWDCGDDAEARGVLGCNVRDGKDRCRSCTGVNVLKMAAAGGGGGADARAHAHMLRVRVEVDGGSTGSGRLGCPFGRGVIVRGLRRGVFVLWMAEYDVFLLLDARERRAATHGAHRLCTCGPDGLTLTIKVRHDSVAWSLHDPPAQLRSVAQDQEACCDGEVDISGENRQEEEEKKYGSEESVKEERTKVPSKLSFRTQTDGDQVLHVVNFILDVATTSPPFALRKSGLQVAACATHLIGN